MLLLQARSEVNRWNNDYISIFPSLELEYLRYYFLLGCDGSESHEMRPEDKFVEYLFHSNKWRMHSSLTYSGKSLYTECLSPAQNIFRIVVPQLTVTYPPL